ncbi:tryptophan halogenase family protein [Rheinheimera tangshanensis]|uniref:Tryptophan 7-halogenase n=1 Tax=Rheinheimera tangshanensis TaxID=400153 RepID=A0A5C8LZ31_9GAMM|nr:tryptophan halogenase family protein [Rheinheimera tangshanensis]TXK82067.1 tryptophan 7-halogenase [Rheinheimera tangshanensis]GGM51786.1 tryptophan halogenase [Rheinheimera tangshanensis]
MQQVKKVVVAGGGTAGWVAAAALSKRLQGLIEVVLIESEEIGTVGVGESTIPPVQLFHNLLGIDEQEFMKATDATFKLAISFENWGQTGDQYFHPFGVTGKGSFLTDFQHYYLHGLTLGVDAPFGDYCYELQAAKQHKFGKTDKSNINYAYHLDAGRYARFLRKFSEDLGAVRIEGKIAQVQQHVNGDIRSLVLESGQEITGDLFIDCTGFRALLIEQTLKTGYDHWDHWLPCNKAVVVQTEPGPNIHPYTRAIAHDSGWQWKIPLQHRGGNGLVYASDYLSDEKAKQRLLDGLEAPALFEPRVLSYQTGRRKKFWNKNCVAIGLSSGFIEPLESTSIFLFMSGIIRLLRLFPFNGVTPALMDEYNQQSITEVEKIRDFIILHYHQTERSDSPFWDYCRTMSIPDTLAHRIELFKESAHAFQTGDEMFRLESWSHVMLGQRLRPNSYHQLVAALNQGELSRHLHSIRETINAAVDRLPSHRDFLRQYCPSTIS